ncbi:MAG: hypothetical protein JSR67_11495 [Proteobacteria bacterium]|nr:hypothetical protein [Pseudomonadota bacterium]
MSPRNSRAAGCPRWPLALAAVVPLAGAAASAAAATTVIVPRISAASAWTDNIDLALPGQTESGEIWQLIPGVSLKYDSDWLRTNLDYQVQALFYTGGQHGHDTYQNGNIFAEGKLVPDWLFLDGNAQRTQSQVDPTRNNNIDVIFPVGNIANTTAAAITPTLRHRFHWVQMEGRYSWGFTHNQDANGVGQQPAPAPPPRCCRRFAYDQQDRAAVVPYYPYLNYALANSSNRDGSFALSSAEPKAKLTWSARYQRSETTYTNVNAPRYLNESLLGELGWLAWPGLRLLGQGGKESDPRLGVSRGGLDASQWAAGFDWSDDPQNDLRALAGKRFFGRQYQLSWTRQSRLLGLIVNYLEQPTTDANRYLPQGFNNPLNLPGVPQFSRLTPDVYVLKSLNASAVLTGRVTQVGLVLTSERRIYLTLLGAPVTSPIEDTQRAVTAFGSRRLGPRITAMASVNFANNDLREGAVAQYKDRRYTAQLTDQVGPRTSVNLTFNHFQRTGAQVYKANMLMLSGTMTFGAAGAAPGAAGPGIPGAAGYAQPLPGAYGAPGPAVPPVGGFGPQ